MPSILNALKLGDLDHNEVELLFDEHFGRWQTKADRTVFEHEHDDAALTVTYTKAGRFADIVTGPGARPGDVYDLAKLIDTELRGALTYKVGRRFLLSRYPVTGGFVSADFQILPPPSGAPIAPDLPGGVRLSGGDPFLLEFRFRSSASHSLDSDRRTRAEQRWSSVLNAFSFTAVSRPSTMAEAIWARDPMDRNPASRLVVTGYYYPEMVLQAEAFTSMERIPGIALVDRKVGQRGASFCLPDEFPELIRLYTGLPSGDRARFERACYWLHHACESVYSSRASATIALVAAIESLNLPADERERCPSCRQIIGSTRLFHELVESLAPGYDATRANIYSLRSRFVHGSLTPESDASSRLGGARYFSGVSKQSS